VGEGAKIGGVLGDILDDQHGAIGCGGVAAEELEVVGAHVVVVIFEEAQAELGDAGLVDEGEGGGIEIDRVPVAGERGGTLARLRL
jgi:hypothetical protein